MKRTRHHSLGNAGLVLLSLLVFSCGFAPFYASGQKFNINRVSEIVEHQTTRDEIFMMFGTPVQTNLGDTSRASWWRYEYTHLGFVIMEQAALEINFADNRVDDYLLIIDRSRY